MKALTIRQPYATLIALGVKTIETRSRRAPQALIGQTIAIHAGKHRPKDVWCSASADPVFPPPLARLYDYGKCVDPQESNDGEWWRYRWDGPLGAIVATATLADCVPVCEFSPDHEADYHHVCIETSSAPTIYPGSIEPEFGDDITDQLPYGDFQPGRWAWLLTDVKPTTERCPACMGTWAPCRVCFTQQGYIGGAGTCPPIPATGKQGLWEWQP